MFETISASAKGKSENHLVFLGADLVVPEGAPALDADSKFKGARGEVREQLTAKGRVLYAGLGSENDSFHAAGTALRRLAQAEVTDVKVHGPVDPRELGCAAQIIAWNPVQFKGSGSKPKELGKLEMILADKKSVEAFEMGQGIGRAMNTSRDLSLTPPNIATPMYIADLAEKMAKQFDMKCTVMRGKELEKERMTGHINVGKASENEPCIIRLEYRPKGVKGKPVVLVGKTMCYDTGGLSLKISGSMVGMKQDKDGGCAVLGAMQAIAETLKPNVAVVALLCAAENSVSDEAYRPDDILTFRNGVTVEVTNTDAEGRLVLADGLCWACDKEDPALIVDIATLTGGVVTALGKVFAGGFSNDDAAFAAVSASSAATGERVWRLPLHDEYRELMKSPVADILNSNPNRQAHPIQGAAFLTYFVKEGTPWVHLDIAGVHNAEKDSGPFIKGPNGWGVRLMADLVARWK